MIVSLAVKEAERVRYRQSSPIASGPFLQVSHSGPSSSANGLQGYEDTDEWDTTDIVDTWEVLCASLLPIHPVVVLRAGRSQGQFTSQSTDDSLHCV